MTEVDPLRELLHVPVANGGISALLLVPDPGESTVDKARAGEVMSHLAVLLRAIEGRDPNFGTSADKDGASTDADTPAWPQAYRKVVAFLVWLLSDEQLRDKLLEGDGNGSPLVAFMSFAGSPEEAGLTDNVRLERLLLFSFVMGLMMSHLTALASIRLGASIPIRPDLVVFDMISSLTSLPATGQHDAYFSAAVEMANCLSLAAAYYGRVGEEQVRAHLQATAESVLRLPELTGLASRAYFLIEKYGLKAVERRFEQQLSLALQQYFGFLTIPTIPGADEAISSA